MSDGINTDKVIVNAGAGGGHDGGAGLAAVIAALGNRNEGGDSAGLIAALGNRNDGMSAMLPALMAGGGFGGGANALWPIILLALLGRGRGGPFGGGDDCGGGGLQGEFLMSKLGDIQGAIPLAASQVENSICRTEASITNQINQVGLAQLAATTGVKDSVQNGVATLLAAGSNNTEKVLSAICGLSSKIDANQIMDLQRQLGVAQAAAAEERNHARVREVEVNVSQNVNQQQAQAQLQAQIGGLLSGFNLLASQVQRVRADQDIVNLGTMVASGTQATTSTQVR